MRIIKNLWDVNRLQRNKVLGKEFSNHLKEYLRYLQEELDSIEPGAYEVEDTGFIVILEHVDDVRDLSTVGLNPEDQGLLGTIPEWIEKVELDRTEYYRLLVIYNDVFAVTFYSAVGNHDGELEEWLEERIL
mgnify:CR=1 FL=1